MNLRRLYVGVQIDTGGCVDFLGNPAGHRMVVIYVHYAFFILDPSNIHIPFFNTIGLKELTVSGNRRNVPGIQAEVVVFF